MKIVLSGIERVFDCAEDGIWSVIIERQGLFYEIVSDIRKQIDGFEGKSVLSEENKVLRMDKYTEQIMQFIPFDMNKKTLLNRIISEMQKMSISADFYLETNEILTEWEKLLMNLEFEIPANLNFTKINIESLLKASGIMIEEEYDSLATKIVDYIQLVEKFEGRKLFVLVNMRSFVDDEEMQRFIDTVRERDYQIILLENMEHTLLRGEKRYLVDENLCEICYTDKGYKV